MPGKCSWSDCKSDSRVKGTSADIRYYPMPNPKRKPVQCSTWIKACGRVDSELNIGNINTNTKVCSLVGEYFKNINYHFFFFCFRRSSKILIEIVRLSITSSAQRSTNLATEVIIFIMPLFLTMYR